MKIALFGKSVSSDNLVYVDRLIGKLRERGSRIKIHKPFYDIISNYVDLDFEHDIFSGHEEIRENTDCLFSVGGDGTILDALSLIRDSGIPILGINIGRLGFLSSISKDEILPAIDNVLNGEYELDPRTLIEMKDPQDLFGDMNYALNDLTVNRKDSTSLVVTHVYVDDKFLNTYWSDGLIVATPTGSTAYSLSSGGPILTPGSENFVITPIAAHNLTIRPFVIPNNCRIRIIVEGRDEQFFVSLDSRTAVIESKYELTIKKAGFKVNLVRMKDKDFFSTIRDKLKWGFDIRN